MNFYHHRCSSPPHRFQGARCVHTLRHAFAPRSPAEVVPLKRCLCMVGRSPSTNPLVPISVGNHPGHPSIFRGLHPHAMPMEVPTIPEGPQRTWAEAATLEIGLLRCPMGLGDSDRCMVQNLGNHGTADVRHFGLGDYS